MLIKMKSKDLNAFVGEAIKGHERVIDKALKIEATKVLFPMYVKPKLGPREDLEDDDIYYCLKGDGGLVINLGPDRNMVNEESLNNSRPLGHTFRVSIGLVSNTTKELSFIAANAKKKSWLGKNVSLGVKNPKGSPYLAATTNLVGLSANLLFYAWSICQETRRFFTCDNRCEGLSAKELDSLPLPLLKFMSTRYIIANEVEAGRDPTENLKRMGEEFWAGVDIAAKK